MKHECEFKEQCGFFQKFGGRKSQVWKGLVGFYCRGGANRFCERLSRYRANLTVGSDHIMPTGESVPDVFLKLE